MQRYIEDRYRSIMAIIGTTSISLILSYFVRVHREEVPAPVEEIPIVEDEPQDTAMAIMQNFGFSRAPGNALTWQDMAVEEMTRQVVFYVVLTVSNLFWTLVLRIVRR